MMRHRCSGVFSIDLSLALTATAAGGRMRRLHVQGASWSNTAPSSANGKIGRVIYAYCLVVCTRTRTRTRTRTHAHAHTTVRHAQLRRVGTLGGDSAMRWLHHWLIPSALARSTPGYIPCPHPAHSLPLARISCCTQATDPCASK